ncbi:acetate kinase [Buchnera aphidicola (Hyadaphis tataricae)]|uniref:Acetate kinase n=1 Tax=Buchnera aphidicola (Hyadaphis tataricae) TaxID=1241859 RepID=A0A4D6Y643_9GAMM|nr:acetate kinase [Buchnera aphidicola]QCI21491.1 acetate kinase [Buchnera aphidicola (Hyadaphis tataricae)]
MDNNLKNLILVFNCGSSSVKFKILNPDNEKTYLSGLIERLFSSDTHITWTYLERKYKTQIGSNIDYTFALNFIIEKILLKKKNILKNLVGIGHRVVHGGTKIKKSVLIDDKIIKYIKEANCFAPLHNPANLIGITSCIERYPILSKKNVAVFDTSFYQNMPEHAFLYAIPYIFYKQYGIRRYGAHGISHNYVAKKVCIFLKKSFDSLNVITCHLGNGASVSAICNGVCIDTSMGFTPLEGLVMGTRSGDIDPSIIFFMHKKLNIKIDDIENILARQSGLLGLSEVSSDFRYFERNYDIDESATRSVNVFCHRLAKYISSYTSVLKNRLDALVFTGGIGENVPLIRKLTLFKLSLLNFKVNVSLNDSLKLGKSGLITECDSRPAFVIPTNEELFIAQETMKIIKKT